MISYLQDRLVAAMHALPIELKSYDSAYPTKETMLAVDATGIIIDRNDKAQAITWRDIQSLVVPD